MQKVVSRTVFVALREPTLAAVVGLVANYAKEERLVFSREGKAVKSA